MPKNSTSCAGKGIMKRSKMVPNSNTNLPFLKIPLSSLSGQVFLKRTNEGFFPGRQRMVNNAPAFIGAPGLPDVIGPDVTQ